jgi:hypothetical protein
MKRATAVAAATAASLAGAAGCDTGVPASPTVIPPANAVSDAAAVDAGLADAATFDATASDASETSTYAVCPPGMDASFGSIYGQMLSTGSCGSNLSSCHNTTGASNSNLLDFSLDASAVYSELLGDGGGKRAVNADHPSVVVLRVEPHNAGASMLYIKLTLDASNDPQYGSGMPLTAPGSVCPDAISAVRDWINAGASPQ